MAYRRRRVVRRRRSSYGRRGRSRRPVRGLRIGYRM
nr:MAG: hypothetical protein [Microvirus sp.]